MNTTLLPSGLFDLLPPVAAQQAAAVSTLLACMVSYGYEQVRPPLMEFESSLLAGRRAALAGQTFRVVDPLSGAMLGFRPDITLQVARIASSRLAGSPRPLRMAYAGPTLQVRADALKSERMHFQAGLELIGPSTPEADAEVMVIACRAMEALGIRDITLDLNVPGLVPLLLKKEEYENSALLEAIARKDSAMVRSFMPTHAETLIALMSSAGNAPAALASLAELSLPESTSALLVQLGKVIACVEREKLDIAITVDPLESRGFAYHTGIQFSVFAQGARGEVARGGRYMLEESAEEAAGFTLYVDTLLPVLPALMPLKRVYVPYGSLLHETETLRGEGYITVHGVEKVADTQAEAERLGCTFIWQEGNVRNR